MALHWKWNNMWRFNHVHLNVAISPQYKKLW